MASPKGEYRWLDDFETSLTEYGKGSTFLAVKEVKKLVRKTRRALRMADEIQKVLDETVRLLETAEKVKDSNNIPTALAKARTRLVCSEGEQLGGNREAGYGKNNQS